MDPSILTSLCEPVYLDYIPVNLDLFIWTRLFGPDYINTSTRSRLFGPLYLDPFIWSNLFGPVNLEYSIWTILNGPIYLYLFIWTSLIGPIYLDLLSGPVYLEFWFVWASFGFYFVAVFSLQFWHFCKFHVSQPKIFPCQLQYYQQYIQEPKPHPNFFNGAYISNASFNQKSPGHLKVGFCDVTHIQIDIQMDQHCGQ